MADPPPPPDAAVDPDDDDLIAYLDGELDEPDARSVESMLALDPTVRAKADAYKKTYDLLDYLPRPEPSADFTARTLTRLQPAVASGSAVVLSAAEPSAGVASVRRRGLAWATLAVIGLTAGFAAHAGLRAAVGPPRVDPDTLPLSDLRVIERLPLYLGVDDLAFARSLSEPGLFGRTDVETIESEPTAHRPDLSPDDRDRLIRMFLDYPPARREQLRTLDAALTGLPPADRQRLDRTLEAYALWLDRLPDADRTAVLAAPDPTARLGVIRQTRERHWRDQLPTRRKDQLNLTADPQEVVRLVAQWKAADDARAEEWALARRLWDDLHRGRESRPWPFGQPALARDVDEYVRTALGADLSLKAEAKFEVPPACRLDRGEFLELKYRREAAEAEGFWLLYGACVFRLAERHPYLPPPATGKPVTDIQQLSKDVVKLVKSKKGGQDVIRTRGQWPDFALDVAAAVRKDEAVLATPLGPARPAEFGPQLRAFVEQTLRPNLTPDESTSLDDLEGRWPDYPRRLVELARQHDLPVPGVTLPGPPSRWRKYYGAADGR